MTNLVRIRLNRWKQKLIDQTLRNPLLNFRPHKVTTIRISEGNPAEIFRTLQLESRPMTFKAVEQQSRAALTDNPIKEEKLNGGTFEPTEASTDSAAAPQGHYKVTELKVELPKDTLELSLLRIFQKATSHFDEQGFSSLCLSLGILEWSDRDNEETRLRAPLILLPVQLVRETARSKFTLISTQDDPVLNPAISEKLRLSHRVQLPEVPDSYEDFDPTQYFAEVAKAIADEKYWRVTEEINLGFFAFHKFVMYKDLDVAEETYATHKIIQTLASGRSEMIGAAVQDSEVENLDEVLKPETTFQVLDADSSQQQAILAAKSGSNLVIEGPPGTGKSQTITNLIAEMLADGKTVLFVSEKMAALEVVYNRLESSGLKEFCLRLHSNKTSKKSVYEEIQRSLDNIRPADHSADSALIRLSTLRSHLNEYANALHAPFGTLNTSPFQVLGQLSSQCPELPVVNAEIPQLADCNQESLDHHRRNLAHHSKLALELAPIAEHPFKDSELLGLTATEEDALHEALCRTEAIAQQLQDKCDDLAEQIGATQIESMGQAKRLCDIGRSLLESPGAAESLLINDKWNSLSQDTAKLLQCGERQANLRLEVLRSFNQKLLAEDFKQRLESYSNKSKLLYKHAIPEFWRQRNYFCKFFQPAYKPKSTQHLITDLEKALQYQEDLLFIQETEKQGQELFESRWLGLNSNWQELSSFAQWIVKIRSFIVDGALTAKGLSLAAKGQLVAEPIISAIQDIDWLIDEVRSQVAQVCKLGAFDSVKEEYIGFAKEINWLAQWALVLSKNIRRIHEKIAFNQSKAACLTAITGPFFSRFFAQNHDAGFLEASFIRCFLRRWLDLVYSNRPILSQFQPGRHEQLIDEFRELDSKSLKLAKQRLRHNICKARDNQLKSIQLQDELLILQKQIRARSKLPLRKLFKHVPKVIKSIKPCFMMSPLSAAQFIDLTSDPFDVVIFDEASQITSEDAIGSIVRGKQLVVVGDTKQLPPTNFFAVQLVDDAPLRSDVEEHEELKIVDLASVLDNCLASGFALRKLKWHYRSRHESLIAFSNREFYKGELLTFPGPDTGVEERGLTFEYVQGVYQGSGINPKEAEVVADAVCQHIRECPHLSLGVGTFNVKQQTLIKDELDKRRRENPSLEFFFARKGEDEFFVKNLENIQGDDRDVIFLSITYGPGIDGQVRHNFGPINGENGWRRLNVILTRAKLILKVFASMKADDIDPTRATGLGASFLKDFLAYAEKGARSVPQVSTWALTQSPFEQTVHDELVARGLRLIPQVGRAGYKIDFGVLDHDLPGRFLAGIECDGITYHGAATARDRDRLRQKVLEDLGWKLTRIWSTGWYHDRETQIKKVFDFVSEQKRIILEPQLGFQPEVENTNSDPEQPLDSTPHAESNFAASVGSANASAESTSATVIAQQLVPYPMTPIAILGDATAFNAANDQTIMNTMKFVINIEAPVHIEDIKRRVATHWQISRLGTRINARLDKLLSSIIENKEARLQESFVWKNEQTKVSARSRNIKEFSVESVPPEELDEFILYVLKDRQSASKEELAGVVAKAIGFGRASQPLVDRIQTRIQLLLDQSALEPCSAGIRLATLPRQQQDYGAGVESVSLVLG